MWDERYSTDDYVYGTEPNDFLREQAELIGEAPKRVLCLADGEGRNGVYLAGLGHWVTSVDASSVGLRKAAQLAEEKDVALTTLNADLTAHEFAPESYDAVVSIFCHLPTSRPIRPSRRPAIPAAPAPRTAPSRPPSSMPPSPSWRSSSAGSASARCWRGAAIPARAAWCSSSPASPDEEPPCHP